MVQNNIFEQPTWKYYIAQDVVTFQRRLQLQLGVLGFHYRTYGVKEPKVDDFVPYWLEGEKKKKEEQVNQFYEIYFRKCINEYVYCKTLLLKDKYF